MSSTAQILANQTNARLSTGPKTPEGKAASARNATRHGLSGTFQVLPNEDQSKFDQLLDQYRAEFAPDSEHETFLIEQMAQSRWKLARFHRLESAVVKQMVAAGDPGQSADEIIAAAILSGTAKGLTSLQRYAAAAERSYYKAHHELEQGRASRVKTDALALQNHIEKYIFAPLPGERERKAAAVQNEPKLVPPDAPLSVIGKRFYTAPGENLALRL